MQPFRQSSLVQQPDGEIIRAVLDAAVTPDAESAIQFDLGLLSLKVAQEDPKTSDLQLSDEPPISLPSE